MKARAIAPDSLTEKMVPLPAMKGLNQRGGSSSAMLFAGVGGPRSSHFTVWRQWGHAGGRTVTLEKKEEAEEMCDSAEGTGDRREPTRQGSWQLAFDPVPQYLKSDQG